MPNEAQHVCVWARRNVLAFCFCITNCHKWPSRTMPVYYQLPCQGTGQRQVSSQAPQEAEVRCHHPPFCQPRLLSHARVPTTEFSSPELQNWGPHFLAGWLPGSFLTSRGLSFLTMQPLHPQRRESSLLSGQAVKMFAGSRRHSVFLPLGFQMLLFIYLLYTHIYEKTSSVTSQWWFTSNRILGIKITPGTIILKPQF